MNSAAYNQGMEDYENNYPKKNPFVEGTSDFEAYEDGYNYAAEDSFLEEEMVTQDEIDMYDSLYYDDESDFEDFDMDYEDSFDYYNEY